MNGAFRSLAGLAPLTRLARFARLAGRLVLALCIGLLTLEALSQGIARAGLGLSRHRAHRERTLFLSSLPVELRTEDPEARARGREDRPWFERVESHPFFGYVLDRRWGDFANNHGFMAAVDYPYRARPWEYVIGIFGGSVAQQIAHQAHTLAEALRPALVRRGYHKVTVLDFAQGGSKQPSAFYMLAYYLPDLDMAINLDGLNDAFQAERQLPDYPAAFPTPLIYRPLLSLSSSPYAARDAARLALLDERAASITRLVDESVLRHALFPHLAWRAWRRTYESRASALRQSLQSAGRDFFEGVEPPSDDGGRAALRRYFDLYRRTTHHSHLLAEAEGKLFFHFVHPNQYVTGAKPLSDEERALYTSDHPPGFHTARYRRLGEISAALRARGVASHSLERLFADEPRTMYRDACCHLNREGVARVNLAIARHILDSGRLEGVAPPDPSAPTAALSPELAGLTAPGPRPRSAATSHVRRDGHVPGRVARAFLGPPEGGARWLSLELGLPAGLDRQRVEVVVDGRPVGVVRLGAGGAEPVAARLPLPALPAEAVPPVHVVELRADRAAPHPDWPMERYAFRLFAIALESPEPD
ncbi:MAG: hypothetical protein ACQGVK_07860 [Myxococcota bacterium]